MSSEQQPMGKQHSESTPQAREFVQRVEKYFGPWRGAWAAAGIRDWLTVRGVSRRVLSELFLDLREHRPIEPTNTLSIADLAVMLRSYMPVGVPQIVSPEDAENTLPREEAAKRMGEVLRGLAKGAKTGVSERPEVEEW